MGEKRTNQNTEQEEMNQIERKIYALHADLLKAGYDNDTAFIAMTMIIASLLKSDNS